MRVLHRLRQACTVRAGGLLLVRKMCVSANSYSFLKTWLTYPNALRHLILQVLVLPTYGLSFHTCRTKSLLTPLPTHWADDLFSL